MKSCHHYFLNLPQASSSSPSADTSHFRCSSCSTWIVSLASRCLPAIYMGPPPPPTGPPRCCRGYLVKRKTSHVTSLAKSHQRCHTTFRIKPVCSGPFTVWSNPPHSHCAPRTHRTNLSPHDMTCDTSVPLHVPEPCLYWERVPSLFTPIQNSIPYQACRKWNLLWEPS